MRMLAEPRVHLWTRDEYYRLAEAGLFDDRRMELIEGQIIDMSPMGSLHATAVTLIARVLESIFGQEYFIRWQMPLGLDELSEPEPDVAVIAGDVRDFINTHPSSAALIVEVSETSLEYDRTTKASLYAKAGIADYWIVNLVDRQLEIYRNPAENAPQNYAYADRLVFVAGEQVSPLAIPQTKVAVAELLP